MFLPLFLHSKTFNQKFWHLFLERLDWHLIKKQHRAGLLHFFPLHLCIAGPSRRSRLRQLEEGGRRRRGHRRRRPSGRGRAVGLGHRKAQRQAVGVGWHLLWDLTVGTCGVEMSWSGDAMVYAYRKTSIGNQGSLVSGGTKDFDCSSSGKG